MTRPISLVLLLLAVAALALVAVLPLVRRGREEIRKEED